jgi:hypothetical protein
MDLFTAIDELAQKQTIVAWPNPATEHTTFQILNKENESASLSIFDLQGKLINEIIADKEEMKWYLSDRFGNRVKPGMYLCKYVWGEKAGSIKIMVK